MEVIVRLVNDTDTGRCWFEEKFSSGKWVVMPETESACEGNSRQLLKKTLEARRQQNLRVMRSCGQEEAFTI